MSSLQTIIQEIKTASTESGFVFISEKKVNGDDMSDTLLPAMFIKLDEITYDKFLVKTEQETYPFSIKMVIACSQDPITDLKTIQDLFIYNFSKRATMQRYFLEEKFTLNKSTITNDVKINSNLGGEMCVLEFTIENINKFGGDCA